MDLEKLKEVLKDESKYRLKEARDFVFVKFIDNWNQATSFSKDLRDKLNKECPLEIKADVLTSRNGDSIKAKIILKDNVEIETVLMKHKDGRNTVCVSCQVGCPMGCLFCATGTMGFIRNLTVDEILEQVVFFNRHLKKTTLSEQSESNGLNRVSNVTFMGMGEPFLNYDNVLKAIKVLNDANAFNISIRNISVSTCGVIEGIEKLANSGLQVNLAISLHAPNNKLREQLMPINKRYPLDKVLKAVDDYILKTKRKVMFEYVLIKDINDTDECAKELVELMHKKLYFLNLITFNTVKGSQFQASSNNRIETFKKILKKEKINFVQRYRFGDDIQAACGQFVTGK
ncbi:MAG: 23S rRNA (adenine(2503)-C(2))-methyltransferase [Candidatus Staskawiczbacteria bacterium RIFOXYB2_FULL_32_9]|uniref:Probable dual-specificity RNA methyltransferase RlmN n=1 Tax=Candidatus Staskawiczbacteria bacterium RIFOXYD1_FULL_32_13 TaxID=1802234 RepID=A0A1G2JS98_9BACT|nr:MAG: Ribosomal RNA large subunit methyltransferase N [Parcubacteria group bacterium GW2011_GWC2_32_10]OGZ79251.1 MAG: 23S rRNA (adenine(2503)-C(2))-methyltransferase [Candidatus Staskawiczbacteria bacterium RIFOXYB1_FULL_32_11]OGZ81245.1 MAG: 23S rRNA (adenine(2503)-C(2))-methyltransferase [Candidatus Staskawiczbacteria bacterium RIFOXYB2_FULL_32_9]OGZ85036.1 MAG: 23S rRNA (adenine(2503)-C(2))-methyltransferase [Candidatus Staskawiczbacteria bacterium RIFOXYC2_FULL_32_10]OGZ89311.1 MAG: 23S 